MGLVGRLTPEVCSDVDVIVLRGEPFQRGLQQGRALKDAIHALWYRYKSGFYASASPDAVSRVLGNMLRFLDERFPEVVEELKGVAKGADLTLEEVAKLNFGSAIGTTLQSEHAPAAACSCVAVVDAPEGAVIARNSDQGDSSQLYYALKIVIPDKGIPYIGFGEVGGPWVETAMNAAGLAIGQASAPIQPDQDGYGLPIMHSTHLVAQYAKSARDAVDYLAPVVHAGKGSNLMFADASGDVVALERGHDRQFTRRPADGVLYFANHSMTPEMQAAVLESRIQQNSEGRVARYREIFDTERPDHSTESLRRIISDHGGPVSPCQHGNAAMYTRFACLLIPARREMRLFRGPACTAQPESYFV